MRLEALDDLRLEADVGDGLCRPIVELADERKADLIVLGAHDGGLVSRLFEGSVGDAVAHRAHTDVLIVH